MRPATSRTCAPRPAARGPLVLLTAFATLLASACALSTAREGLPARAGAERSFTAAPPPPGLEAPRHSGSLEVRDFPEEKRLVVTLGPIDLPARAGHGEIDQIPVQSGTVPFDLTIRGYRVEVVDGRGREVPRAVVHHMNLLHPGTRELFLPIMRRVLAASYETPPIRVPGWLLGVPLRGGERFLALAMLHNPTPRSYEGVRVRMVLDYERSETLPLYHVYPFHIDVMFPTGPKAFDLPPGWTTRSWEGRPAIGGAIIGLGGHLHRYARLLVLEDVTQGRVLYRMEPEVGPEGEVHHIPAYRYGGPGLGFPIRPDHRYRVRVSYFNPTPDTIFGGGMGSVAGAFVPFERWPAADSSDPMFAEDYRFVLESQERGHGHGADHGSHGASHPGPGDALARGAGGNEPARGGVE